VPMELSAARDGKAAIANTNNVRCNIRMNYSPLGAELTCGYGHRSYHTTNSPHSFLL
jgi:hypothetical protein